MFHNIWEKITHLFQNKDKKLVAGNRIAVMILGPLGDVINTSGVFKQLKTEYPDSKISIITTERGAPATKGIPEIEDVYIFRKWKGKLQKNLETIRFGLSLRNKFDTVIVLDNSFRSGLCAFLTNAKHRVGRGRELRELLLTDLIPYTSEEKNGDIHVSEHYARCLKPLGIYNENIDTCYAFSEDDKTYVEELLKESDLSDKKIIGFCPACRADYKNILMKDSVEIIKYLNKNSDYQVILTGGNDVKNYIYELKQNNDIEFIDFSGKTSFTQTAALIDRCEKFISVDTACMHLALARKVPTMAIFFSTLYTKWGPKNLGINKRYVNKKNKSIILDDLMKDVCSLPDKSSLK